MKTSGTYSYTVHSVANGNKLSNPSTAVSVLYDILTPTAPTSLIAVTPTASAPALSWQAATDTGGSGLGGYDVYRGTTKVGSTSAAVTSYTDSGLTASTVYQYTVRAKDVAGNVSAASAALSVTTLDRHLARVMEPRAGTPARRLDAIRVLSDAGIPMGVMFAPAIPALNDHEMEAVLSAVEP